jgi:hypothetical protein
MMEKTAEKRLGTRIEPLLLPGIRLFIQGVARELINLSDNGFGVRIDTPSGFHLGQRLDDIRLEIEGNTHRFHGAIAHITRTITGSVLGIRLKIDSIEEYRFIADLQKRCLGTTKNQ